MGSRRRFLANTAFIHGPQALDVHCRLWRFKSFIYVVFFGAWGGRISAFPDCSTVAHVLVSFNLQSEPIHLSKSRHQNLNRHAPKTLKPLRSVPKAA